MTRHQFIISLYSDGHMINTDGRFIIFDSKHNIKESFQSIKNEIHLKDFYHLFRKLLRLNYQRNALVNSYQDYVNREYRPIDVENIEP